MFTSPTGAPLNPTPTTTAERNSSPKQASTKPPCTTPATVLLLLGVPQRVVMQIMGWSPASTARRYQHVVDPLLHATAEKVNDLLWRP